MEITKTEELISDNNGICINCGKVIHSQLEYCDDCYWDIIRNNE